MKSLEGVKVVTAEEMARIERSACDCGASDEAFMESAGKGIAHLTEEFVLECNGAKQALLLVGKGNNGGDAYVAGRLLKERGFCVSALHLFPLAECSPLCQTECRRFQESGGQVSFPKGEEELLFPEEGIVLDGLVGTGFQGKAEGLVAAAIERANRSALPLLAIDIPSGLNGNTGEVGSVAVRATLTFYLGLPKIGFFLKSGWERVGELMRVDFGLEKQFIEEAKAEAFLLHEEALSSLLPPLLRTRHKYQAGYVLGIGASQAMPGAALLASLAALRSGAGLVRLFYPEGMEEALSSAPYELIKEGWDLKEDKRIREEMARAKAMFLGPGMGRSKEAKRAFLHLLGKIKLPCVLDADALYFLSEEKERELPEISLFTPHHQEMQRLLSPTENLWTGTQKFADQKDVTVVLKGAPSVIFHPFTAPLIVPYGDPGMATAGTGDVLTGVLAALLAQGLSPKEAAALGVFLHAIAGEAAAFEKSSYAMIASDVIDFLPEAFNQLLGS
ncbi:MAG: hypothetical protein A3I15_03370 [Chlamydiae bacterium RIFCSPLOWO2_02_FULL_49_12]|nr:MAG: hypothetical protein A3I15_03370 [Chlamydiae bacterium RIFCSPLOWO2_02_FULL_49_12]